MKPSTPSHEDQQLDENAKDENPPPNKESIGINDLNKVYSAYEEHGQIEEVNSNNCQDSHAKFTEKEPNTKIASKIIKNNSGPKLPKLETCYVHKIESKKNFVETNDSKQVNTKSNTQDERNIDPENIQKSFQTMPKPTADTDETYRVGTKPHANPATNEVSDELERAAAVPIQTNNQSDERRPADWRMSMIHLNSLARKTQGKAETSEKRTHERYASDFADGPDRRLTVDDESNKASTALKKKISIKKYSASRHSDKPMIWKLEPHKRLHENSLAQYGKGTCDKKSLTVGGDNLKKSSMKYSRKTDISNENVSDQIQKVKKREKKRVRFLETLPDNNANQNKRRIMKPETAKRYFEVTVL